MDWGYDQVPKSDELKPISDEDQTKARLKETQILFRQQKYSEAKKILQEILRDDPDNAVAYNNLGSIYLIRGRLARAERYFKKALELDPKLADAEENLNSILKMKKGKSRTEIRSEIEELEEECKRLIQEGEIDEAIEKYKKIIELDATNVKVYNNLGILYFQQEDLEEAERYFVRALELYFHHGMVFDDQYTIIRDNLNRLREKIGSNVSDFVRDNLTNQLKDMLQPGEEFIDTFMGTMKVFFEGRQNEINTVLALTNKRLIIYYKAPKVYGGEATLLSYAHSEIKASKMVKGILKNTLMISAKDANFKLTSQNRNEVKKFLESIREVQEGGVSKTIAAIPSGFVAGKVETPVSGDVVTKVAFSLMEILKELNFMTDSEIETKRKLILSGNKPPSPFRRKGGLFSGREIEDEI